MQRPGGVVAIAVVELVGSALMLAMAGLVAALAAVVNPSALAMPPGASAPAPAAAQVLLGAVVFLLFAGWGIVTAVGLLRLQVWALVSTLLFALLLISGGGFAAAVMALLAVPGASPAATAFARGLAVAMGLGVVGLGVWWIAYLVRRRTRAAFYDAHPVAGRRRPLSMLVLAWLMIPAGVITLVSGPFSAHASPIVIAGVALHGGVGRWVYSALGVVDLVIGIGLAGLRRWAWIAAIVWVILGALNMVATWARPAALRSMRQAVQAAPGQPEIAAMLTSGLFLGLLAAFSVAAVVVTLYFLWTRRGAFQPLPG